MYHQENTKSKVYDQLFVKAASITGDSVLATKLAAELVLLLPDKAFEKDQPQDTTLILGELKNDHFDESTQIGDLLTDMWAFHYYTPPEEPLKILMSSNGGEVDAGMAIISAINSIRREGRQVHCHVAGYAYSVAFDILQFCDLRTAEPTASLMTHSEKWANKDDDNAFNRIHEGIASKKLMSLVYEQIALRTGRSVDYYIKQIKDKDWWLTPSEALAEGLLDKIVEVPPFTKTPYVRTPRPKKPTAPEEPVAA